MRAVFGLPNDETTRRSERGDRVIEYDLKHLLAVLNWATVAGDGRGVPLLNRNPLKGMPLVAELNPKRPMLTAEQYGPLLDAGDHINGAQSR